MSARPKMANHHREPTHDNIAACAFLIWVGEGRPDGRDREHWYQAETQLHITRAHDGWLGDSEHAEERTPGE